MTWRSALALLLVLCAPAGAAGQDALLPQHLAALRAQLDPRAGNALDHIDGLGRQLLAARGYLRAGSTLDQRWSWTDVEIAAWQGSAEQTALDQEIGKVRAVFERNNPGYSLFVNPQVRSFDLQLQRWNASASVAQAGDRMKAAMETAIHKRGFPAPGSPAAVARFGQLLRDHAPRPVPTLAVPGLSGHGRMSAVDFQIRQGTRTVAGPDSASVQKVWIAQGWRDRLQAAVQAASTRFKGPLISPDEPWHYDYRP